jgi:hypothetical protein
MHLMDDNTGEERQAIEGVLQALLNVRYKFVTVNELQELLGEKLTLIRKFPLYKSIGNRFA